MWCCFSLETTGMQLWFDLPFGGPWELMLEMRPKIQSSWEMKHLKVRHRLLFAMISFPWKLIALESGRQSPSLSLRRVVYFEIAWRSERYRAMNSLRSRYIQSPLYHLTEYESLSCLPDSEQCFRDLPVSSFVQLSVTWTENTESDKNGRVRGLVRRVVSV